MTTSASAGIATLPKAEASRVVSQHPELADAATPEPVVVAFAVRDAVEAAELTDLLRVVRNHLMHGRGTREEVLRALLPTGRLSVSPAVLEQVNRNAEAQAELADEFGLRTSTQVAELAGSTAGNRAATANRWTKQRRMFAVDVDGSQRFPGFQFGENGRPLPVVADVLAALGDRLTRWELALWFSSDNDWLGGQRPVDVLDSDPNLVVEAAHRLADEILL